MRVRIAAPQILAQRISVPGPGEVQSAETFVDLTLENVLEEATSQHGTGTPKVEGPARARRPKQMNEQSRAATLPYV